MHMYKRYAIFKRHITKTYFEKKKNFRINKSGNTKE